jgi:ABC-type polysaccharide/polyol phosphate transport system ATPase subunit
MAPTIYAEGLSKRYPLGIVGGYDTLREALARLGRRRSAERQMVWALRDVSLEVEEGESIGILGRNGAGKTTLLRILARITEPTAGRGWVAGRVGALLEVGTGFHPELTGRENVELSAGLLGMRRREVRLRFDEIVGFAGVEAFLDTPVKRYSTGMYLRLAFSVAAHLEPEVLLVDEVLAVGDAEFQRRCLGKMGELGREGRTVVFVSHDSGAVAELCQRAVWLDGGEVVRDGKANEVAEEYMSSLLGREGEILPIPAHHGPTSLDSIEILTSRDDHSPRRGEPVRVRLRLSGELPPGLDLAIYVLDDQGRRIIDDALSDHAAIPPGGEGLSTTITLPPVLRAGDYALGVWMGTPHEEYLDAEVHAFRVAPRGEDRDEWVRRPRLVQPPVEWKIDA